ncbi:hypothetical protein BS78_03G102700 [Paspalum vaginatum]|nr:hypothetical protein BS78_03G102700 [Paspalum vaginatum]
MGLVKEDKKMKKRAGAKEGKIVTVKEEKVKKERKVYELPGQKHDPPAERDPLRIFYESLYDRVPTSDMASTWLMEWGLLPLDVAKQVFEKKQGQKLKSPVKTIVAKRKPASPTTKSPSSSAKKPAVAANNAGKQTSQKKRKARDDSDDDEDDDFMEPKPAMAANNAGKQTSQKKRKARDDSDDDDDFMEPKSKTKRSKA